MKVHFFIHFLHPYFELNCFTGLTYKVLRYDVEKWYGQDLSGLLKNEECKSKVQNKLENNKYLNNCTKAVLIKEKY